MVLVLGGMAGLGLFALIVARPQFGAYLYLFVSPLIVGIARGELIPFARPNELLILMIAAALGTRAILSMCSGQFRGVAICRMDVAFVLLAVTSSIVPILWRFARGLPLSTDDILYSMVLWKYYLLYRSFQASISTVPQLSRCLVVSMASGTIVAVVGMFQVLGLFGVAEFLHAHYDQPFEGHLDVMTTRGTSTVASSFGLADLMIMNLMIAMALLHVGGQRRLHLVAVSAIFLCGCVAAGAFSGFIGLAVAVLAFGVITGRLIQFIGYGIPVALAASAVFWPVIEHRLAGFESPSGLPHSWVGRWKNLQEAFFPQLFSDLNWILGVQPAPRLPAPETWREYIYIESGYVWLLWIGGIPFFLAFVYFVCVALQDLWKLVRTRRDAVGVTATATLSYLFVILVLMLFDPHLTGRGAADLFFPLLALSFMRERQAYRAGPVPAERALGGRVSGWAAGNAGVARRGQGALGRGW